ncbi:MAG TPA: FAD synthetase family protein [Candidatus Limnocylindrales bacterium]|nr:FAD synthetase family protein [Candidatus Limnocylindrales bacterium]
MSDRRVPPGLTVVPGVDSLVADHGPLFAVVGVFDGLHVGHAYLLRHLVDEASRRSAHAAVITFDHHPDEVIVGAAPPLLVDPGERVRLLGEAGVAVAIVQHFDAALRATPYDAFIGRITRRTRLAGLLMTPEAAFGHERRGTPDALAALGAASEPPFDVVVVPPFTLDGHPVSSSEIRRLVAAGDLAGAARVLGRPLSVVGRPDAHGALEFAMPMALPPAGGYPVSVEAVDDGGALSAIAHVEHGGRLVLDRVPWADRALRVVF